MASPPRRRESLAFYAVLKDQADSGLRLRGGDGYDRFRLQNLSPPPLLSTPARNIFTDR